MLKTIQDEEYKQQHGVIWHPHIFYHMYIHTHDATNAMQLKDKYLNAH